MKEKREVTLYKCDQCGKTKSDDGLMRMGGSVFNGWLTLEEINISTRVPIRGNKINHFCSKACVIKYLTDSIMPIKEVQDKPSNKVHIDDVGSLSVDM